MKILSLSAIFPYPPSQGKSQRRTYNFLKYLNESYSVTLVTPNCGETAEEIEELKQIVDDLVIFPKIQEKKSEKFLSKAKQWGLFLQRGITSEILSAYNLEIQHWIDSQIESNQFDLITCEGSPTEIYIRSHWYNKLPIIMNIHRSVYGFSKHQLAYTSSKNGLIQRLSLPFLQRYEQKYYSKFSAIVTMTYEDRHTLKTLDLEVPITAIPNGIDLAKYPKRPTNRGGQQIILTGAMDKLANIDAARYFSLEIFPALRQRYPEASLEIVGLRLTPQVIELGQYSGITVTGKVPSIVEYLHRATVCVLPLRQGRGIKRKTIEALAVGMPLVASDVALANLAVDGSDVPLCAMRANKVDEYVYAIARLFEDPKLRERISNNGRVMIEQEFGWEKRAQRYEQVLLQVYDKFTG
jgi:polysaccharide biosynthesis protein PslH